MSRELFCCGSAMALLAFVAIQPAWADVPAPELVIEGRIDDIGPNSITVMGIKVHVPSGKADTPTRTGVDLIRLTDKLDGRDKGFIGGTAIVTGGSINGEVTATEVFSDVNENVVVGEVTSASNSRGELEVNGLAMVPTNSSSVIPPARPMNIYGFEINPNTVDPGSLISIEGYLADDGSKLYYHSLEADTGTPINSFKSEVSIARASCRDRADANKDELEIRGWVHKAGMPTLSGTLPAITLTYPALTTSRPPATTTGSAQIVPVADPAAPQYAQFRYRSSNRNLDGCPLKISASWQGDIDTEIATVDTDAAP
jgi:hypothetical protein